MGVFMKKSVPFILLFAVLLLSFCFPQDDMDDFLRSLHPTSVSAPAQTEAGAESAHKESVPEEKAESLPSSAENTAFSAAGNASAAEKGSSSENNVSSEAAGLLENGTFSADSGVSSAAEASAGDALSLEIVIPPKKRPSSPDAKKVEAARRKDEDGTDFEKNQNVIRFGTASEIGGVIDSITSSEDVRYYDDFYDLFQITKSNEIKGKILDYFAKQEDGCLEDFAVEVLSDPYDIPVSLVEKCFGYVSATGCKEAGPALVRILETGEEKYFNAALSALGKTGGVKEAKYLAQYLERDDLTVPQRQALMRTLGAMGASETWEDIRRIALDEDENGFVRMYAAEAMGKMKNDDSVPVLIKLFEEGDPNMRQYCIKGLAYYPDSKEARSTVIQAIRDDHYKVRIEAISAVKKLNMTEAVPYLTYRAKNDPENAVKKECFPALAELKTKEADSFLIAQITDKSVVDSVKYQAAEALMKSGTAGEDEIIALAKETLKDDRRKSLRQNLGKLFIKYARPGYAELCVLYLQSDDVLTQSQGLELFKNARYESARPSVQAVADNKKSSAANRKRARSLLGLSDEDGTENASASEQPVKAPAEKSSSVRNDADAK